MSGIQYVRCSIRSGGFSGERRFSIQLADGTTLNGTASVRYLMDSKKKPLQEGAPAPGKSIDGFVMCRVVDKDDATDTVTVEVPSSELADVPNEELLTTA